MRPVRDIRSFFNKPPSSAPPDAAQRDSTVPQQWPSSQGETAPPETSQNKSTPSPIPSSIPAKRARSDTKEATSTNLPPSTSQSSTNSNASKKVTVNGEQVVLNSDSDSDELEELDFSSIRSTLRKPTSSSVKPSESSRGPRATRAQTKDNDLRKPPTISNITKPTLSRLVRDAQKDAEVQKRIAVGLVDLERPVENTPPPDLFGEDPLAGLPGDTAEDHHKKKRLALAIQRTNALGEDAVYHFFGESCEAGLVREAPFPIQSLPQHGWTASFKSPWQRDQAFLCGFAQQVFQIQKLPTELAKWTIDQICSGRHDNLSASYIELLEAHPDHLKSILTTAELNNLFLDLGADIERIEKQVEPVYENTQTSKRLLPSSLKWILQLLQSAAKYLHPESQQHALFILVHVCFDDSVMADAATLHAVQDTIELLMRNIPNLAPTLEAVVPKLLLRITNPILQKNLVISLPSKSPLTAYFKRHMALAFLIYPTPLNIPLDDPSVSSLIHAHLDNSSGFNITRETDYRILAARFALLDIAIGPGLSSVPHQPPKDPASPTFVKKPSLSPEDRAFNKEIDKLVEHVKILSNSIIEAGAISDLSRLDAKDYSERLCHRLENTVRIGGRKKKTIFENEDEIEQSRRIFSKWFGSAAEKASATVVSTSAANHIRLDDEDIIDDDDFDGMDASA